MKKRLVWLSLALTVFACGPSPDGCSPAPPVAPESPAASGSSAQPAQTVSANVQNTWFIPPIRNPLSNTLVPDTAIPIEDNLLPKTAFEDFSNIIIEVALFDPDKTEKFGTGLLPPKDNPALQVYQEEPKPVFRYRGEALAPSFDLTADMPPIRDQGVRGTCSFFTWAGLIDFLDKEAGLYTTGISPNFLSWLYQEQYGGFNSVHSSIGGGQVLSEGSSLNVIGDLLDASAGGSVMQQYQRWYSKALMPGQGVLLESLSPYNRYQAFTVAQLRSLNTEQRARLFLGDTLTDQLKSEPLPVRRLMTYLVHRDLNSLKAAIQSRHPVVIGVPVFQSFMSDGGRGRVITAPASAPGTSDSGHAILLVGYHNDPAEQGGGYFILRNSWGPYWGNQGYGKISYQYVLDYGWSTLTADSIPSSDLSNFFDLGAQGGSTDISLN